MNNNDLYLDNLRGQLMAYNLMSSILKETISKWDSGDEIILTELTKQLEVAKTTARSIDKQIFEITKHMA